MLLLFLDKNSLILLFKQEKTDLKNREEVGSTNLFLSQKKLSIFNFSMIFNTLFHTLHIAKYIQDRAGV